MTQTQASNREGMMKFGQGNFAEYVRQNRQAVIQAAASHVDAKRLYRLILNSVTMTPALASCTIESIFRAMLQSAQVGLEPGTPLGEAYLIPYGTQCQFIVGYRGYIALARRSGLGINIEASVVYEGDLFEYEQGLERILRHRPAFGEPNPNKITHAYAIARHRDGQVQMDVMTKAEIDAIRSRSRAGSSGPWVTDYAEMAKKTVVRRLSKYLPLSIEMARAVEIDTTNELGEIGEVPALLLGTTNPLETDITDGETLNLETGEVTPAAR